MNTLISPKSKYSKSFPVVILAVIFAVGFLFLIAGFPLKALACGHLPPCPSPPSLPCHFPFPGCHPGPSLHAISGMKFNDLNENAINDDEPGLQGWTITISKPCFFKDSTITDENGNYSFSGLYPGTYTICEVQQEGWEQTYPEENDGCHIVEIEDEDIEDLDFGNYLAPYCGDGNLDEGEECDDGNIENGDGCSATCLIEEPEPICGNGILEGDEECEIGQECLCEQGYVCNTQTCLCEESEPTPCAISGMKFSDLNQNGENDDEPGLEGWTIQLKRPLPCGCGQWEVIDEEITDENGNYCFESVEPGLYRLKEVLQEGWTPTAPVDPQYYEFTFEQGDELIYDFGNYYEEEPQPVCGNGILEGDEECELGHECLCGEGYICNTQTCFCEEEELPPVCDPEIELVVNSGFETPIVDNPYKWDIFNSSEVLGWDVEWVSMSPSTYNSHPRPLSAFLELQRGVNDWSPYEGEQYAELDTDWDGPGGSLSGEPASARIYQDIPTIPGEEYNVSFYFSPRPQTNNENNRLEFKWDGAVVDDTITGAGENNTTWVKYEYTLTATGDITRIEFADIGNPSDSLGTFLDNVSVRCKPYQEPEPICGNEVVEGDEECDDGNIENGDGCSAICEIEEPTPGCVDADQDTYYAYDEVYCSEGNDCDDSNPAVNPGATEICDNQIDDDCDGDVDCDDEDCSEAECCQPTECTPEETQPCDTGQLGICSAGTQTCSGEGFWGECVQTNQPGEEICGNGLDDDCDGSVDEGCALAVNGGGGGGGSDRPHTCGDGRLSPFGTEECDDGNKIDGDGCSSTCKIEITEEGEVAGEEIELEEEIPVGPPAPPAPAPAPKIEAGMVGVAVSEVKEEAPEEELCPECPECPTCEAPEGFLASVFGALGKGCYKCLPWWVILIFALYALIKLLIDLKKKKKARAITWLVWLGVLVILTILFYLLNYRCVGIWVYLILGLITLFIWVFTTDRKKRGLIFLLGFIVLLIFLIVWLIKKCLYLWLIIVLLAIYFIIAILLPKKKEKKEKKEKAGESFLVE